MPILIWLLLLPLDVLMTFAAYLLAPLLPALATDAGWLPRGLSWFQTPDNPLDGDADFSATHAATPRYMRRVLWLWRNPAYGFAWTVLAARLVDGASFTFAGDPAVQDRPVFKAGWMWLRSGRYWHWYLVWPSFTGRCLRINLGWKLTPDGHNANAMFVCSANPFMRRG
ncbi:DUF7338 family protein [Amantichitinum ursilacus]|uniref:Uncharacterized protein n=1 Tax=Amantichitinum ursilacus TaxID=857265 RepID=A0A0N0XJ75_9NEIS|nr:hypothetical protein [Amantichitinum ursilacus]KPC53039.1 hypothetical protein WG78_11130 [Amantichitinum ursilacus]